ncbi:MAG: DUF1540 domain-containing protein, partial [Candidatus Methylomirabilis sp.]|nr:DUF1540 domain-containing protein [Deltaproteobacteria bacterium]
MKITLELAQVSACEVGDCGYNAKGACHAKAITIGDMFTPGCDTFMN